MTNPGPSDSLYRPPDREISGRKVVAGMFTFATTIIVLLFAYWHFYTKPFHELQAAIAERFPMSLPRAIGGKHKSHKEDSRATMRIIIRVAFDPSIETEKSDLYGRILAKLADQYHGLSQYEMLQIRLLHRVPEKEWETWEVDKPIEEWRKNLADNPPPDRPPPEAKLPQ
jgi:hypothetical protein